jgi:hypothetical protein
MLEHVYSKLRIGYPYSARPREGGDQFANRLASLCDVVVTNRY